MGVLIGREQHVVYGLSVNFPFLNMSGGDIDNSSSYTLMMCLFSTCMT